MSKLQQVRWNLTCLMRDVTTGQWRKMRFHWAGLRRAVA